MKAVGKYIIIEIVKEEVKTSSGLFLGEEDAKNQRYRKGIVLTVGKLVDEIKEGDKIYYDLHAGHTMLLDDKEVHIILERDVVIVS